MSNLASQPIPKNLRQQMVERISTASEQELMLLHDLMLIAEKEHLWKRIQRDAEAEEAAGKWENLPELVREVREAIKARNRAA